MFRSCANYFVDGNSGNLSFYYIRADPDCKWLFGHVDKKHLNTFGSTWEIPSALSSVGQSQFFTQPDKRKHPGEVIDCEIYIHTKTEKYGAKKFAVIFHLFCLR